MTETLAQAKLLLELDRAQWLREQGAKSVHITRIEPPDATPKRDIIFGRF